MSQVYFRKLILRGFGLYRDEASFEFHEGVNVFVAPNESGKTTIALGVAAVLFGLYSGTDKENLTSARLRNWHEPPAFRGELFFESDRVLYHIRRNFLDNLVVVRCHLTAGDWAELQRGVHNPRANKPNVTYLSFLREKVGVESLEMYRKTFFLEQPLPAGEMLDDKVQHLFSGGEVNYRAALKSLTEALREVTMDWGRYSQNLKSGRVPRRLDSLRSHRTELEEQVKVESRDSLELRALITELNTLMAKEDVLRKSLARAEAARNAYHRWLALRDRYVGERQRVKDLEAAVHQLRELEEQYQAIRLQKRARNLPGQKENYEQLAEVQEHLKRYESLDRLGPLNLDMVTAAQMWVGERLRQREELKALAAGAHGESPALTQTKLQLETLRMRMEQRYGFSPECLPMELLQEKQYLEDQLQHLERRLARAGQDKARSSWWYAAGGLVSGALALVFLGGFPGVALFVVLGTLLLLLVFLTRKTSGLAEMRDERKRVANKLMALALRHPVGKLSYELLRPLCEDANAYQRLVAEVNASSKAQQDVRAQAEEQLRDYEHQLQAVIEEHPSPDLQRPQGFLSVMEHVTASTYLSPTLLRELDALRQKIQESMRYRDSLKAISANIERLEAEAEASLTEKQALKGQLLATYQAEKLDDLEEMRDLQAGQLHLTLKDWRSLIEEHPLLPSVEESRDGALLSLRKEQLAEEAQRLAAELKSLELLIFEKHIRQGQLEGRATRNVAATEDYLNELRAEERALEMEAQALGLAIDELEAAANEFQATHRHALAAASTRHFRHITATNRRVVVGEDLQISILEEDEQAIHPRQLSQGAHDQLYLALRLAIADLSVEDRNIPFIFDDPFLTSDEERLNRIRHALQGLNRQSILLTHSRRLAEWGKPVTVWGP